MKKRHEGTKARRHGGGRTGASSLRTFVSLCHRASILAALIAFPGGCFAKPSVFHIVDYRDGGEKKYRETFREAYYDLDPQGNVTIVLHRSDPNPDNPRQPILQTIRLQSFWRPIPGRTVVERTQLNALVTYAIVSGRSGATFEGAGSVFFDKDWPTSKLEGTVEYSSLRPTRRLAAGDDLFKQASLEGTFRATPNARRCLRLANDIDRFFGPLPPYPPR